MKFFLYSNCSKIRVSFILSFLILSFLHSNFAQTQKYIPAPNKHQADSLQVILQHANNDTLRMVIYSKLTSYANEIRQDSLHYYNDKKLELARKLNQKIWEGQALQTNVFSNMGKDIPKALESLRKGMIIAEDPSSEKNVYIEPNVDSFTTPHTLRLGLLSVLLMQYSFISSASKDFEQARDYLKKAISIAESINDDEHLCVFYRFIQDPFRDLGKLDSVLWAAEKSIYHGKKIGFKVFLSSNYVDEGVIYAKRNDLVKAHKYFTEAINCSDTMNASLANTYRLISDGYADAHQPDSSIYYLKKALARYRETLGDNPNAYGDIYFDLSVEYKEKGNIDSAYYYLNRSTTINENVNLKKIEEMKKYQKFFIEEQNKLKDAEKRNVQLQNYGLIAGLGLFSIIGIVLYRNNKQKQKANVVLQEQKTELVQTLAKLTSAQNQLIQSEKLASLGELTAGIAHEIQNPLNFVNNFSKMSIELANEVRDEITKIEMAQNDKEYIGDIIKDLNSNQTKIAFHGERASSIVKGMLEHSRHDTGKREMTDINKLCDQYFRLADSGLRAKFKDFTCKMESHFDITIPEMEVVPQDIGRVILNIINNAFYAVNERKNNSNLIGFEDYQPTVFLTTKKIGDKVEIRIKDNGTGMPKNVQEKIFQPFFTTKPTGIGNTGLGMSLAYDIITKGHSGTLKVESTEGIGTDIVINI